MVIETDLADVEAASEEQRGMAFSGLATGAVPGVTCIPGVALAFEGPLLVDAHLGARAWVHTLVYVCN